LIRLKLLPIFIAEGMMFVDVVKVGARALAGMIGVVAALVVGAILIGLFLPDLDLFPKRTIAIQGLADISVDADRVDVSASVKTAAATAAEALEKNSSIVGAMIAGLTVDGIDRRSIRTTGFGIRPLHKRTDGGYGLDERTITGYVAETSISISLPLAQYSGKIVDRLVRLGATDIGHIDFVVSDFSRHEGVIRVEAVQDALRKGTAIASALGFKLGRVVRVERDEKSDSILAGRDFVGSPSNQTETISVMPRSRTFSGAVNVVFELD
jgi:uncharacterized protein